jgi:hypothetical protein
MAATLSDTLVACARELEHVSDQFAEQGLPTNHISAASALLHTIAERAAAPEHPAPIGGEEFAASVGDTPHPREVLALSGKQWDFSLPGCKTFGCIDGLTDEESYRRSHLQLLDRMGGLEADYGPRHHLLEAVAERWDEFDEEQRWRWQAADTLLSYFGRRDDLDDQERYQAFAAIPRMAADLIGKLDDVEYDEYCPDRDGVSRRKARAAADEAQQLAAAVAAWADDL